VPAREGGSFDLIPDCEAVAHIIETVVTEKENGTKQRSVFTWEIIDGPHAKRRIWDGQNIVHPNEQTQTIGQRAVKDIAAAVGHKGAVTNSNQIEFKPVLIKIRTEPPQNGYEAKNVVKGYKPVGGVGAAPAAASAAPAARPWGGKAA
jgi:nitric oxide synthase oxygenase domain/subunit